MARVSVRKQLIALLRRNVLLKWRRSKAQVFMEIFLPLAFVGFLSGLSNLTNPAPAIPYFPPVSLAEPMFLGKLTSRQYYITPNHSSVLTLVQEALSPAGVSPQQIHIFPDFETSEAAYKTADESEEKIIGINFNGNDISNYSIRVEYGSLPDTSPNSLYEEGSGCRSNLGYCSANSYLISDFTILQRLIDTAIIRMTSGKMSFGPPDLKAQLMPKPEFIPNLQFIQSFVSIYMVFAYSFFINFLMICIVTEKETKVKEAMRVMGMRDSAYWLSWGITYACIILLVSILCTIIAWLGNLLASSNMFLFFLLIYLYGLSIITLSFAITPFFSKAQTAGGLSGFATLILGSLYFVVSLTRTESNEDGPVSIIPTGGQWALSLFSPVALALSMDQAIHLDAAKGGMTFNNIDIGQFPIYASLVMLVVDIVLYALLAIYLDNVIPGEHGSRRAPHYFLKPSYWCPRKDTNDDLLNLVENNDTNVPKENMEEIASEFKDKNTLRIFNIRKSFKNTTAVDGISMDIYEGQITALLGHNGAGKTTLINMLIGMTKPSRGTAFINKMDVSDSEDMDEIRSMTGTCPQHNILFKELTCREHIQLFARLRGMDEQSVGAQVQTSLSEVDLLDQIDTQAENLSGGQKRRLSLAISLVGDPKVVFLDEPTAGLDPSARRSVWNLLKAKREGRVILLTTHFMDEADILADRKAVISKGRLKCVGSSLFLKNRFGLGYHLGLVVEQRSGHDALIELIKSHVENASLTRMHSQELVFTLPLSDASVFPVLLSAIEDAINTGDERYGIINYGVSMTTLEEVFLRIGEEEEINDVGDRNKTDLSLYSTAKVSPAITSPSDGVTADHRQSNDSIAGNLSNIPPFALDEKTKSSRQFWGLVKIRVLFAKRNPGLIFMRLIFPAIFILAGSAGQIGLKGVESNIDSTSPDSLELGPGLYAKVNGQNSSYSNSNATIQLGGAGSSYDNFVSSMETTGVVLSFLPVDANLLDVGPHNLGTFVDGVEETGQVVNVSLRLLYNDSAVHSLPAVVNLASNTLMSMMNLSQSIQVSSQPWPDLDAEIGPSALANIGGNIMLGIGIIAVAPTFASFVIRERTEKHRTQLRVSGMSTSLYWSAVIFGDLVQYSISGGLCVIVLLIFRTTWLWHGGAVLSLVIMMLVFLPSNTFFAYALSFLFAKPETLDSSLSNIMIWGSFLPYVGVSVADAFNSDIGTALHYVMCIILPTYPFFGGLHFLTKIHLQGILASGDTTPSIPVSKYFEPKSNLLPVFIVPVVHIVLLNILLRILEVQQTGGDVKEALSCKAEDKMIPMDNHYVIEEEDDDVAAERERVDKLAPGDSIAVVKNLQKMFPKDSTKSCSCKKPASQKMRCVVKKTTFAVDAGEVFGLLGPNGAGKSTTLNTMIAETSPTKGRVSVLGYDIHSNLSEAYKYIGYCPQEDALFAYISLKEHVEFYATVRGIRKECIPTLTDYFLKALDIEEHADKLATKLSGGTKRKLSFIISMLGTSRVVLLDEPSTGMDPKSKRFLWDTISSGFHDSDKAAVLTTHYMDEADTLCTRVAIMVNGELEALGSTQHLKNKYGSGYILEVKISVSEEGSDRALAGIEDFILRLLPSAFELERFGARLIYKVPKSDIQAISKIFAAIESEKESLHIEEYSFSQTTLEQVFLELTRHQVDSDGTEEEPASPRRRLSQRGRPQSAAVSDRSTSANVVSVRL